MLSNPTLEHREGVDPVRKPVHNGQVRPQEIPHGWQVHDNGTPSFELYRHFDPSHMNWNGSGLVIKTAYRKGNIDFAQTVTLPAGEHYVCVDTLMQSTWGNDDHEVYWTVRVNGEPATYYLRRQRGEQSFAVRIKTGEELRTEVIVSLHIKHGSMSGEGIVLKRVDVKPDSGGRDVIDELVISPQGEAEFGEGATRTFDLSEYLIGNGDAMLMSTGEHMRSKALGNGTHLNMRNANWRHIWHDDTHIYTGYDIMSEHEVYVTHHDGDYGAPWVKRHMAVGDTFTFQPYVEHKRREDGYTFRDGYPVICIQVYLHLTKWHTARDVLVLRWYDGGTPDDAGVLQETYYYARGRGLVGWSGAQHAATPVQDLEGMKKFPPARLSWFDPSQHPSGFTPPADNDDRPPDVPGSGDVDATPLERISALEARTRKLEQEVARLLKLLVNGKEQD